MQRYWCDTLWFEESSPEISGKEGYVYLASDVGPLIAERDALKAENARLMRSNELAKSMATYRPATEHELNSLVNLMFPERKGEKKEYSLEDVKAFVATVLALQANKYKGAALSAEKPEDGEGR